MAIDRHDPRQAARCFYTGCPNWTMKRDPLDRPICGQHLPPAALSVKTLMIAIGLGALAWAALVGLVFLVIRVLS